MAKVLWGVTECPIPDDALIVIRVKGKIRFFLPDSNEVTIWMEDVEHSIVEDGLGVQFLWVRTSEASLFWTIDLRSYAICSIREYGEIEEVAIDKGVLKIKSSKNNHSWSSLEFKSIV